MENTFAEHRSSGLLVSRDGEVFVPKSGSQLAHCTYGTDNGDGYRKVWYQGKQYLVHRLGTNILERIYNPNIKGSIQEFYKALTDFILDEDEEEENE